MENKPLNLPGLALTPISLVNPRIVCGKCKSGLELNEQGLIRCPSCHTLTGEEGAGTPWLYDGLVPVQDLSKPRNARGK
jgi:hypothetical protein